MAGGCRFSCDLGLGIGIGIGFVFSSSWGHAPPRMRKNKTNANAKAKAKAKAKATRKPIYIHPSRPKNSVRKKSLKKQSASQTIDLVITIQTIQESSKSELSSRFLSTSKFLQSNSNKGSTRNLDAVQASKGKSSCTNKWAAAI